MEVASPDHQQGASGMQHFTYRPTAANTYEEEKLYRGLHPMMGKRLHFWRLSNFNIDRLPSVEDVYLLHAVARDNPKDERLFACAEVRDVTPVRDQAGQVRATAASGTHADRSYGRHPIVSIAAPVHERLYWNRIFLYVWPPLSLEPGRIARHRAQTGTATEGLGLEQVVVRARIPNPATGELRDMVVRISSPGRQRGCS